MNKKTKRLLLALIVVFFLLILTACGQSSASVEPITAESEGFWDGLVLYNFSRVIIWLSELFGGNYGIGIILFTILIRVILIPASIMQMKSTRKMSELSPELEELKEKYDTKDRDQLDRYNQEIAKLYEERGVNPYASCLPLIIQMPILIALYQSISRTPIIAQSDFLWVNLGEPDPYFILPILAALLSFIHTKLTMMNTPSQAGSGVMMYTMPIMIFIISFSLASAISLYFVTSNAFMIAQTLIFNNPFQHRKEREEKLEAERQEELRRTKAIKRAKKTGRSVRK